nr:pollen-specific leucine-rich repeat extensin-like protein [Sinningia speciosa]
MAEKVTTMVLKVDLQCPCCYKKTKKILCKFPEIRDQVYDEKENTVTITVVCCSPEKIRDKLCCEGGKVITSIKIKEPPKHIIPDTNIEPDTTNVVEKPKPAEKPPLKVTVPVNVFPTVFPAMPCCGPSYNDVWWQCYHRYGVPPPPPPPCCDGYYGCDQYGRCYHVRRCDSYFSEENPSACLIM